jgi:hypothetical protein
MASFPNGLRTWLPEHPYATDVDIESKPLATKRSRFAAERVEFPVENS